MQAQQVLGCLLEGSHEEDGQTHKNEVVKAKALG
jgi:hypothetical protein